MGVVLHILATSLRLHECCMHVADPSVEYWSPHPKAPTMVGISLPRWPLIGQTKPMKLFGTGLQDMHFSHLLHIFQGLPT